MREKQEKAQDKQAELDALRAKRAYEQSEREARIKEKNEMMLKKKKIQELGEKFGFKFLETSAKDNININETFDTLVSEILTNYEDNKRASLTLTSNKI